MQYGLSFNLSGIACLVYFAYCISAISSQQLNVQRQSLPFGGDLVIPVSERSGNDSKVISYHVFAVDSTQAQVDLPKLAAMADGYTDDGSVITRHLGSTFVESAWSNRMNNCSLEYFLENTSMDVSSLSLFAALYLSSIMAISLTRKV